MNTNTYSLSNLNKDNSNRPHYLRALNYALQPDSEWGPAKNENRFGRYKPKLDRKFVDQVVVNNTATENDLDNDSSFEMNNIYHIRL